MDGWCQPLPLLPDGVTWRQVGIWVTGLLLVALVGWLLTENNVGNGKAFLLVLVAVVVLTNANSVAKILGRV